MLPIFSSPPTCLGGLSRRSNVSRGPGFRRPKLIVALVVTPMMVCRTVSSLVHGVTTMATCTNQFQKRPLAKAEALERRLKTPTSAAATLQSYRASRDIDLPSFMRHHPSLSVVTGAIIKRKQWPLYFALLMGMCASSYAETLTLREDPETSAIHVFREGGDVAILTQNADPDFRPYIHPVISPDGKSVLTELSPSHHLHQTGVYWGFTRANGRDYFGNPGNGY